TFQGCGFVCWKDEVESYMARPSSGVPPDSTCYKCNGTGHWANQCTSGGAGGGGMNGGMGGSAGNSSYAQARSSRGGQRRSAGSGSSGRTRARTRGGGDSSRSRRGGRGRGGGNSRSAAASAGGNSFSAATDSIDLEFWD
ncbi:hypothetical protein LPJ56_004015, partial [Coemansia sp. RSA 2599]